MELECGHLFSSQINTQSLSLSHECWAFTWLVSSQLFCNYPIYLLSLCFYLYLFCIPLYTSYSMPCCVAGWPAPDDVLYSFAHSSILLPDFFSYLVSLLAALPILSPAFLLVFQLFIRAVGCFRQEK